MSVSVRALLAALAISVALPAGAAAQDDQQPLLGVNVNESHVDLAMIAPKGFNVEFSEMVDGQAVPLGNDIAVSPDGGPSGFAKLLRAVPWRCDRTVRQFVATARGPRGRTVEAFNEARTPGCVNRLSINVPSQVTPGRALRITLRDRWGLGDVSGKTCIAPPQARRRCRTFTFAPGQLAVKIKRRLSKARGVVKIKVSVGGQRFFHRVGVGIRVPRKVLPTMLVTGDSMIQGIDAELADRLRNRYRVARDTRPGTGVSKSLDTPWTTLARQQARAHRPAVTVVFLGANDRFDMATPAGNAVVCCDADWKNEYLRRITAMAQAYSQGERGRVIWALLPPPRDERYAAAMAAVNETILELASQLASVTLVRLDQIFGPLYRESIDGRVVRDPDGLHLSVAGEQMAAQAIIAVDRGGQL
jgi:lysophospholipase L1-like esterase